MSQKNETNRYHFYYPIYNLRGPTNNVKLGYSTILTFDNLPKEIQRKFLFFWKNYFTIYTEWAKTEEEYIDRKKTSTFLHLKVRARNGEEAIEKAFKSAKDSVNILSFLYWVYFPIHHCFYVSQDSEIAGGAGDYYYIPSLWICEYQSKFDEEISKLTAILAKPKSEIEKRIRTALKIFGIQVSITNLQVRFVLLVTCLESLLSTDSGDYLGWKLAEKTAFLAKNRKLVYEEVRKAYAKRSAFIHGSSSQKPLKIITENDVNKMQGTVISVLRKLVEFTESGYAKMKEFDEHIENIKFGEKN